MGWFSSTLTLANSILDRLPSRREALQNNIDDTKRAMDDLQAKKSSEWTITDSGTYYLLADKLQKLEKRALNAGL